MDPLPGVAFQDDIHRWLEAALVCTDHHQETEVLPMMVEGCLMRGSTCAAILCCCAVRWPPDLPAPPAIVLRAARALLQ